ncbi:hypothetical protein CLF_109384 [Clonorchis sinensis]|uniref:Uncharacterized protein n=1 Tax=Clonorchis sinensis TaxID=79923 RepID=G7YSJ5_CLOSI|nr:hypothetical protein CLF_109384 [Clonorchis sinensis]
MLKGDQNRKTIVGLQQRTTNPFEGHLQQLPGALIHCAEKVTHILVSAQQMTCLKSISSPIGAEAVPASAPSAGKRLAHKKRKSYIAKTHMLHTLFSSICPLPFPGRVPATFTLRLSQGRPPLYRILPSVCHTVPFPQYPQISPIMLYSDCNIMIIPDAQYGFRYYDYFPAHREKDRITETQTNNEYCEKCFRCTANRKLMFINAYRIEANVQAWKTCACQGLSPRAPKMDCWSCPQKNRSGDLQRPVGIIDIKNDIVSSVGDRNWLFRFAFFRRRVKRCARGVHCDLGQCIFRFYSFRLRSVDLKAIYSPKFYAAYTGRKPNTILHSVGEPGPGAFFQTTHYRLLNSEASLILRMLLLC